MANSQQERLDQIEVDRDEIRRQILQLEFQHKKDMIEQKKEITAYKKESEIRNRQIELHLRHLSQLAGFTFEELDAMDERLVTAAAPLSRSRQRPL